MSEVVYTMFPVLFLWYCIKYHKVKMENLLVYHLWV